MEVITFASTINLIERRAIARPLRRAFFMPYSHLFDVIHKISAVASRPKRQPLLPFLNPSFDELIVDGEGGNRFFCCQFNNQLIMVKSTTNPTLHTVEVTQCQLAILKHFNGKDATEMARLIRSVSTSAITSDNAAYDDINVLLMFAESVQELANEHYETAWTFHHKWKDKV
jgi:hypothetical protein